MSMQTDHHSEHHPEQQKSQRTLTILVAAGLIALAVLALWFNAS
jgi:hypothetical protein